ncbi:MAG: hypothetical protein JO250_12030 [Armatimonadetes bacterium]|nr:hypothetical protein [Armatimonadota bacterium]
MLYGKIAVVRALLLAALCLASLSPLPTRAQTTPAAMRSHSKLQPVTVRATDEQAAHLTLTDGTALDALIRPSSVFLKGGLVVPPSAFPAGAKALLRSRTRASDGAVSVVLLCDPASAAALDTYRKKTLVGTVQSLDEKTLVVRPAGGGTPLTLRITPKTLCRRNGADATAAAFAPGAPVAVITRGLPSGLLMAALVTDAGADAARERAALKPARLSGHVLDVQPEKSLLTVAAVKPKGRRVVAVGPDTRIRVRKEDATLDDLKPGMRVSVRLGRGADAEGHPLAASLSASDAVPVKAHRSLPLAGGR